MRNTSKHKSDSISTAKRKARSIHLATMREARRKGKYDFARYCRKRYNALK